ncbi:protocadherin Fat 4-like [Ptychodera flava]|uniref:protocadherin Fat 4-like n=1 Tax=Ptychodera flava TaxID=63121 RepID=UPI00396A7D47
MVNLYRQERTVASNVDGYFDIDSASGEIKIVSTIDYDSLTTNPINLIIEATDGTNTASASVPILVLDVNDADPVCSPVNILVSIAENTAVGTSVTSLSCTDADVDDVLNYAFSVSHPDFTIDASTGLVTVAGTIDYEAGPTQYDLEIDVTDGSGGKAVVYLTVRVTVINEYSPTFVPVTWTVSLPEDTPVDSSITDASTYARDNDASPFNIQKYDILSITNVDTSTDVTGDGIFDIEHSNGLIKLTSRLDYESGTQYTIVVTATDTVTVGTGTVTVMVVDVNEYSPSCSFGADVVELAESTSPGVVISTATLGCTDDDQSATFGSASLTYSLTSNPGGKFSVSAAGDISLISALDYETTSSYSLMLRVSDGDGLYTDIPIFIYVSNVDDSSPYFTAAFSVAIPENTPVGDDVILVTAQDDDDPDTLEGTITYTILSGDPDDQFSIDEVSGQVEVRGLLDRETIPIYYVVVQATDGVGGSATTTVTITMQDVNDEIPVCTTTSFTDVVNETEAAGFVIRSLGCSDGDIGDILTYTLTVGSPTIFDVSSGDLVLSTARDYESGDRKFDIQVTVVDSVSNTHVISGTIHIDPVNEYLPVFASASYPADILENQIAGTILTTVSADDDDHPDRGHGVVNYYFDPSCTDCVKFQLNPDTGEVSTAAVFDREDTVTYTLDVIAMDSDNQDTATVVVTILDENDCVPEFTTAYSSITIQEELPAPQTLLSLTAVDLDDPATDDNGKPTYFISAGDPGGYFAIGTFDGVLKTAKKIDYETIKEFDLVIGSEDRNGDASSLNDYTNVKVEVLPKNEYAPVFATNPISLTIPENSDVGSSLFAILATDADDGSDGSIVYEMAFHSSFHLDGETGDFTLKAPLDRETTSSYTLSVKAVDQGSPQRSAVGTISLTITDFNDNAPVCTPSYVELEEPEDIAPTTTITTLSCSDDDAGPDNNRLTYTIIQEDGTASSGTKFSIDATGGQVKIASALDFETSTEHTLVIDVKDNGATALTTTVSITVEVTPVNENDPTFTAPPGSVNVDEDELIDFLVTTLTADANDDGESVTFSIEPNDPRFFCDAYSGEIRLLQQLDADPSPQVITLTVRATDDGSYHGIRSTDATLTINIDDVNDNAPEFSEFSYSFYCPGNAAIGEAVGVVVADDIDSGLNGDFDYSIASQDPSDGIFSVDSSTGQISVGSDVNLDQETTDTYVLTVFAIDKGTTAKTGTTYVTVTITAYNDYAPTFGPTPTYTVYLAENSPFGTPVETVTASDKDNGLDGEFEYQITAGDDGKFVIDPSNGEITLIGDIDFETHPTPYELTVIAVDKGTNAGPLTATTTVTVNVLSVNDNVPTCDKGLYSVNVPDGTPVNTVIIMTSCTDGDSDSPNNDLSYTVLSGAGDIDVNANGEVIVENPLTFATAPLYTLVVEVSDGGTPSLSSTFTVIVDVDASNNMVPAFSISPYIVGVPEDTSIGTSLVTIEASDSDGGGAGLVGYTIISGNDDGKFRINGTTGEMFLAKSVDREDVPFYSVIVTAADKGDPPLSANVTVEFTIEDANDKTPVCDPVYSVTIEEEDTTIIDLQQLNCTDDDDENTVNDDLEYFIASGDPDDEFEIDANGMVKNTGVLDLETTEFYTLVIHAIDGGSPRLTGTTTVYVRVTGINDNDPVFSPVVQSTSVNEDTAIGTSIYSILATDPDRHQDGSLYYKIVSGNDDNMFGVNSANGKIYVANNLDRELLDTYSLVVEVNDLATDPAERRTATGTVVITILDANDEAPLCDPMEPTIYVSENAIANDIVDVLNCTDADIAGFNGAFTFELVSGNDDNRFYLLENQVKVTYAPDYEEQDKYILGIKLVDKGIPQQTSTTTVTVVVKPENEFTPQFVVPVGGYVFEINEDAALATVIDAVTVSDDDAGVDGTSRFYVIAGNNEGKFGIDRSSGEIFTIGLLDREMTASYELTIIAKDSVPLSGKERNDTTTVIINVLDVNDNLPELSPYYLVLTIMEGLDVGTVIQPITVTDWDEGINAESDLEIISGNVGFTFEFSGNNLVVNRRVDLAVAEIYHLTVKATDRGIYPGPLENTGIIIIHVKSINEYSPSFSLDDDILLISEGTPIGGLVYQGNADDLDVGCHGELKYVIANVDPPSGSNHFYVDEASGLSLLASYLDRETLDTYTVNLTATDDSCNDTDIRSGSIILHIRVTDINDNTPVFSQPSGYTFSVDENIPINTIVGQVRASDIDDGINSEIMYEIDELTSVTAFSVDRDGGGITSLEELDHERQPGYSFLVKAIDKGTPSRSSVVQVVIHVLDVNDNHPIIDPDDLKVSCFENEPEGTLITPVDAYDLDSTTNGEFLYEIIDGNTNFAIKIDPNTGSLYTSEIPLDRELIPEYILTIRTTDFGDPELTYTATVTVVVLDLNDNDPVANPVFYEDTVLESIPVGTSVFDIEATDSDINENGNLTYTFLTGNTENKFSLELTTGVIRVNKPLNREALDEYTLYILIEDQGEVKRSATVVASVFLEDVNDSPPRFTPRSYNFAVEEHSAGGVLLGTVYAEDQDLGTNGEFEFSLIAGNGFGKFDVSSATGAVTMLVANLDREVQSSYELTVRAQDNGNPPLFSDAKVRISVSDINDHVPTFTEPFYSAEVVENAVIATSLLRVRATDDDIGNNAALTYSIDPLNTEANTYFQMDGTTGELTVRQGMDYETDQEITFNVNVQDSAEVPLADFARVTITIIDVNDNSPIISPCFANNEISYLHATEKGILAQFAASDADQNNDVTFEFSPSSYVFQIGKQSGAITAIPGVEPAVASKYVLQLLARDDGYPQQTSDPCLARIDTFDPYIYMIDLYMDSTTQAEFDEKRSLYLSTLEGLLKARIPSARVGISHLSGGGARRRRRLLGADDLVIHTYAVENGNADNVYGVENQKVFLTSEYLHSVFAADIFDNPVGELKDIDIYKVQKHPGPDWFRTPEGIAGLTLGILSAIALLTLPCLCYCCCKAGMCTGCCDGGCCGGKGGGCRNPFRSCFDSSPKKPRGRRLTDKKQPTDKKDGFKNKGQGDGDDNLKKNNKKGLQSNLLGPSADKPSAKSGGLGSVTKPAPGSGKSVNVGGGNPNANPNIGVLGYPGLSVGPNKFRQAAEQAAANSGDSTAKSIANRTAPPSSTGGGGGAPPSAKPSGRYGGGSLLDAGGDGGKGGSGGDSKPDAPKIDAGQRRWRDK